MTAQVLILSEDAVFSRMLALEFRFLGLRAAAAPGWTEGLVGDVVILDLDSVLPPSEQSVGTLIGFTRNRALSASDSYRRCSLILHRPFDLQLLSREVLASLPGVPTAMAGRPLSSSPAFRFDPDRGAIMGDEVEVLLSPQEARLLSLLLGAQGQAVTREAITEALGSGEGNKAEVYICYLRRKLGTVPGAPGIKTVRGVGYRIEN